MAGSSKVSSLNCRRRRRELLFYAALNIGAIGVALLLAELFVVLAGWAPVVYRINFSGRSPYRLSTNPVLGYEFKPNFRDPDADGNQSYPYINAGGFRDIERRRTKPPGTKRIIMLGDSVIAGLGLPDLEQTVPRQLERLLRPSGIEVLNFGINGYCTRGEVELLRMRGLGYEPDMVILTFVQNDYKDFNNELLRVRPEHAPLSKFLFLHSSLFRVLCVRQNWFNYRLESELISGDHGEHLRTGSDQQSLESERAAKGGSIGLNHIRAIGPNNVAEGFRELREISRRHGFKVAVVVWPHFSESDIVDVESYNLLEPLPCTQGQRLAVEEFAQKTGFPCFRLAPYFRADFQHRQQAAGRTPLNPHLYTVNEGDDCHPSPEGARVAASAIAELITIHPELRP